MPWEMAIVRLGVLLLTVSLSVTLVVAGCSRSLLLPPDVAKEVEEALGYALAPTNLPKGLEFNKGGVMEIPKPPEWPDIPPLVELTYYKSGDEPGGHGLLVIYPYPWPPDFSGPSGLQTPEDVISEITVKHRTAYLVCGMWSEEVWSAVRETAEVPADAEWDYDAATILFFAVDLPGGETIGVFLAVTPDPAAWISDTELVRIAESVGVID